MKSVEDRIRARIRRAPSGRIMTNRDFAAELRQLESDINAVK